MPPARKPTILICNGALWPDNDSAGPNISVRALAKALAGDFDIRFLARDRPFGAMQPLIKHGDWIEQHFAKVRYCKVSRVWADGLRSILGKTPHDLLWLNGFFDKEFTIPALMLRKLKLIPRTPVIVSPRGEFADGALGLKASRKSSYIEVAHRLGLFSDVTIHATNEDERHAIRSRFPWARSYGCAANIRPIIAEPEHQSAPAGSPLRMAFIGRVSPVKNLDYALLALAKVRAPVKLSIFGPMQDAAYGRACQDIAEKLPPNVTVAFEGEVANDAIPAIIAAADLLFLPTKGENFGHAIFEALCCGVPILISDQTPWRGLESLGAGWDLPLAEPSRFTAAVDSFANASPDERQRMRKSARALAERYVLSSTAVEDTKKLVFQALACQTVARPAAYVSYP